MVALDDRFLLGRFREAFVVDGRGSNPVEAIFKVMLQFDFIDGLLTCSEDGKSPKLILKSDEVKITQTSSCFGINALLKKAIQKYRLSKLAVYAPSCAIDGLNKTQYFGIGCNWTKTAIALKVSFLCPGLLTDRGVTAEVIDLCRRSVGVSRFFFDGRGLHYFFDDGNSITVPAEVHHRYVNSACRYCLNPAGRGTDITCINVREKDRIVLLVRSERGWSTLAQVQRNSPGSVLFVKADRKLLEGITAFLREKMFLNIADIVERVDLGLPLPKWNDNKLRKFYRLWNSTDINLEEEVF